MSDYTCLSQKGFHIDTAVFLAEASEVAYAGGAVSKEWAKARGFPAAVLFDSSNVQGFWAIKDQTALLVFRGTSNAEQWLRDARFYPVKHPWGRVHRGFKDGVEDVASSVDEFAAKAKGLSHVWISGHSLGGALALIAAARLKMNGITSSIYTYGQPMVGLGAFAERFGIELCGRLHRFVNQSDVVTRVPPGFLYRHAGIVKRIVRPGVLETALESAISAPVLEGVALESAEAIVGAQLEKPVMIDVDLPPLSEAEFSMLQMSLGADLDSYDATDPLEAAVGEKSAVESGKLPAIQEVETDGFEFERMPGWFSDHPIRHYVRLLTEIRDKR